MGYLYSKKKILKGMCFMSLFFLLSNVSFSMYDKDSDVDIFPRKFDHSIFDVFNDGGVKYEDKVKIVFVNKGERADSEASVYINMNKKILAGIFIPYDEWNEFGGDDIIVESKCEEVSPEIMVRCFECCFIPSEARADNKGTMLRFRTNEIYSKFNKNIGSWLKIALMLEVINFMINDGAEFKQRALYSMMLPLQYSFSEIDFSRGNELRGLTAFTCGLFKSSPTNMTNIWKGMIDVYLRSLLNKSKFANNLGSFKEDFKYLLDAFPCVLEGKSRYLLLSSHKDYDASGQLVTDRIKSAFKYLESLDIVDLTLVSESDEFHSAFSKSTTLFILSNDSLYPELANNSSLVEDINIRCLFNKKHCVGNYLSKSDFLIDPKICFLRERAGTESHHDFRLFLDDDQLLEINPSVFSMKSSSMVKKKKTTDITGCMKGRAKVRSLRF